MKDFKKEIEEIVNKGNDQVSKASEVVNERVSKASEAMNDSFTKANEAMNDSITKASSYLNEGFTKASEIFNEGLKDISARIELERTKLDLKSQIGHHEKIVNKSYFRLGEAYFKAVEEEGEMSEVTDIVDIIKANKKIIGM